MIKLTLKTNYGTYSIEVDEESLTIYDMWDMVFRPTLLAAGYLESSVDSLMDNDG